MKETLMTVALILFSASVSLGATCNSNTSGAGLQQHTAAPASAAPQSTASNPQVPTAPVVPGTH
jgi:hypothetical protein